jgi:peptidyl-Asp metalloendopeptidase
VVGHDCNTGYYAFAHETGHNMGSHHDPASATGETVYPYAHGYLAPDGAFATIMAYWTACAVPNGCPPVNRWSNPLGTYAAQLTGVENVADNARSLNNTAAFVAGFRGSIFVRHVFLPVALQNSDF